MQKTFLTNLFFLIHKNMNAFFSSLVLLTFLNTLGSGFELHSQEMKSFFSM